MGSINFASPFQLQSASGAAATQYPQPYDLLGALARMQPMPPAPQLMADPSYIWVRRRSDGQVVSILPGDFDPKKYDQAIDQAPQDQAVNP
jgi:hypothetical protein